MKNSIKFLFLPILLSIAPALQAMGHFKNFGTRFIQAARNFNTKNDYVAKGLKLATFAAAAHTQWTLSKDFYTEYQWRKDILDSNYTDSQEDLCFSGPQQAYLQNRLRKILPQDKPTYFGVSLRDSKFAFASYGKDAYRIFLPSVFFESPDFFDEEGLCTSEEYLAKCEQKVPEVFEKNMGTVKHELGHCVYGHKKKELDNRIAMRGTINILNAAFSINTLKSLFQNPVTKLGLLGKMSLLGVINPLGIRLLQAYSHSTLLRKHECQADDFSATHADSIEELEESIKEYDEWLKTDSKYNRHKEGFILKAAGFIANFFDSHPSTKDRKQKLMSVIEKRKQQGKS